jgi:2-alkyl-3-oxoalkanoate reductase
MSSRKENTMRVFITGASGAIGTRLVAQLNDRGHEVIGTSRSPKSAERVRALGAEAVELDLLDARAVSKAVLAAQPDAIVHQATALADVRDLKHFDRSFAQTNRLRTDGTDALLAAAREAGVRRFVAQSNVVAYAREAGPVKTEDDPLDSSPLPAMRESLAAIRHLEDAVTAAGGIALRYGSFYGATNDGLVEPVRKRQFPIIGDGGGVFSWTHLDDAAAATALALESDREGAVYNVVDDEPARVREWLPVLAEVLGAKPPRHVPRWLAKLLGGEAVVMMATELRGASNAKAKGELGWALRYPSWREGFVAAYVPADRAPASGRLTRTRPRAAAPTRGTSAAARR